MILGFIQTLVNHKGGVNVHHIARSPVDTVRAPSVVCNVLYVNILYNDLSLSIFRRRRGAPHSRQVNVITFCKLITCYNG